MEKYKYVNFKTLLVLLLLFVSAIVQAEVILTANEYFEKVSVVYGAVKDYEAKLKILQDEEQSSGIIYYKKPNLIRIDFEKPADQVIAVNNEQLVIYIPSYQVILEQDLPLRSSRSLESMASSQGLNFLRDNYKIAYLEGPDPVLLDNETNETVVKLKFSWRDNTKGFKEIIISFDNKGLIRRIKGTQAITNKIVQFDFYNLILNQGIPEERFNYEPPPYANTYKNFLFEESE